MQEDNPSEMGGQSAKYVRAMRRLTAWKWGGVHCGGMSEKEHHEMVWPY